ncbi:MAG: DNA helicase, partial [Cycloclasticus sp.]|nr:DNA helicase [Cycloclasticus sp.]
MNFSDVFEAIKKGAVIITVNQRLARHLSDKVEQAYVKEGAVAWASPTIISFDAWLLHFWQQRFDRADSKAAHLLINKTLLTPEQVLVVWERVIRHASGTELLN